MTDPKDSDAMEAVVYWYRMIDETGSSIADRFTFDKKSPFGIAGKDYSKDFVISCKPLFASATPPAAVIDVEGMKKNEESSYSVYEYRYRKGYNDALDDVKAMFPQIVGRES